MFKLSRVSKLGALGAAACLLGACTSFDPFVVADRSKVSVNPTLNNAVRYAEDTRTAYYDAIKEQVRSARSVTMSARRRVVA